MELDGLLTHGPRVRSASQVPLCVQIIVYMNVEAEKQHSKIPRVDIIGLSLKYVVGQALCSIVRTGLSAHRYVDPTSLKRSLGHNTAICTL